MNNTILEMDVAEAFAEYETLCAIGDCISKQIVMESYIQEAENAPATDNIPAPDVTTFQKFKNWISRIITLIKRNTSKFSRAIQKWLTRGIMGELYKDSEKGKRIKVPKALLDCVKYIVNEDHVKRIFTIIGYTVPDISDYRKWLSLVVRFYPNGDYVSLKATLDREIKKSNPYVNKLIEMKNAPDGATMVEVKFDEFSESIKALQKKSDDMSDSIKEVSSMIGEQKGRIKIDREIEASRGLTIYKDQIIGRGKGYTNYKNEKFDHYVAAMTSLMRWLLIQSNLILYIGMVIPLVGAKSEDKLENDPQAKK